MSKKSSERRKYLRLEVQIGLRTISEDKTVGSPHIKNLSPLGVRFVLEKNVKDGELMDLTLYLDRTKNPVHMQGKVVWHKETRREQNTSYDVGCEFVEIEEDNKNTFLKFFCDLIYESSVAVEKDSG